VSFQFRSRAEFARFFDWHELVALGIVSVAEWRAEKETGPPPVRGGRVDLRWRRQDPLPAGVTVRPDER
jgi:hypothetical protein